MKISQEMRSQLDASNRNIRPNVDGNQSFKGVVQSQVNKLQHEELQKLMQDITLQGDKLARFRSFPDLVKFKRMVKGFLEEAVSNGLEMQSSNSFNLSGHRNLAIVKEIDEKLIALTNEMMNQEKKTVDLLAIIGEIKGLLINIYT